MLARATIVLTAFMILAMPAGPTKAQEVDRIAAVVNDDIISIRDLDLRLKLAITVSGLPDTIENRRRVVPQVLRKMVDEHLQNQEAERLKLAVTSEELSRSIANLERQNHMPPGSLLPALTKAGVDPDAIKDQLKADIIWVKLIMRTLRPNIKVGEEEITDHLDALKQQMGQPEYLLSEIFLPVDDLKQEQEAKRLGERLLEQLRAGAPFSALARQFSRSNTASNGGLLGWVTASALDDEVRDAVVHLQKGQFSTLIRNTAGYVILSLSDTRAVGDIGVEGAKFSMAQVEFPLPPEGGPPLAQLAAKAAEITGRMTSCAEIEDLGRKLHSPQSGRRDNLQLSMLAEPLRPELMALPVGKPSAPVRMGNSLMVMMICSREQVKGKATLPSRDAVRQSLEDQRLDLMARRYLRDLRRAAFIDFRL
jgi:peptidyl-prolyl cis-trans isomerase SurA